MGHLKATGKRGWGFTAAAVLAAWVLAFLPFSPGLSSWSFDVLQLFLAPPAGPDPVIIYMDEQARLDYQQTADRRWDRALHARLLERLCRDEPRVVVFDVVFTQPSDPDADLALARAIQQCGNVVLAGDRVAIPGGYTIVPPLELLETNAASWGTAKVRLDARYVVRRNDPGDDQQPGLAWAAARVAGAAVTERPEARLENIRWLNYYGRDRPFRASSMSYTNAESQAPGFFKDRAVFIGGQPETLLPGDSPDIFGTPFTRWNNRFVPGVDLTALAYSNLVQEAWLQRLPGILELGLLLLSGLGLGWAARSVRPGVGWGVPVAAGGLTAVLAGAWAASGHTWFCWAAVPLVQVPCLLIGRLIRRSTPVPPEEAPTTVSVAPAATPVMAPRQGLVVSDHTLVRCIGEGAYGQVWIARNAIGLCHAVKVIHRSRFGNQEPYDRAFRGIQKFMPISRSHEGFIHVLHVGRNDELGIFYYIMEAADDQADGRQIDPDRYAPLSLATMLKARGRLPARDCRELMLQLTEAVDRLHQRQLIHRDIKPANIIYVEGKPKLADIDLVTDLAPSGQVTQIGTQGYMAPEGPGSAAADVFSLGRILYVALTGKAPEQCPELPTQAAREMDSPLFMDLLQISCKASEADLTWRYATAREMNRALREIVGGR